MTWVIAGNCVNGFALITDVQMTVSRPGKPSLYFNALKKLHVVGNNLCVAFCGDVRTGLLMINDLKELLAEAIGPGQYFDLDGQSATVVSFLEDRYRAIHPTKESPYVEFIFAWNAQEEDELIFRPFCVRFRSPHFHVNSTPQAAMTSFGSGAKTSGYREIGTFLAGKVDETPEYASMFGGLDHETRRWTVSKFRSVATSHAAQLHHPGVSKTTTSCVGLIDWAGMYGPDAYTRISEINQTFGLVKREERTSHDALVTHVFSFERMTDAFQRMAAEDPAKLYGLVEEIQQIHQMRRLEAVTSLPRMEAQTHWHPDEPVHETGLFEDWNSVREFLESKRIDVAACAARA